MPESFLVKLQAQGKISKNTFSTYLRTTASALNTERKWSVHKTFRRHPVRLLKGYVRSIYVLGGMCLSLTLKKVLPTGIILRSVGQKPETFTGHCY